ncbi:MAG: hypothetical protein QNL93_05175 [Opitutae bacterium]
MKSSPKIFFLISSIITISFLHAESDQFIKIDGAVTVVRESEQWVKASVPFNLIRHPLFEKSKSSRPTSKDEVINIEYINNIKIRLSLCFINEEQKKALRGLKLLDAEFYQYYSAEIEYMTIKFDRNTKYAHFLFPATIAERDGFLTSYIKPVGYVVEILYDGIPLELTDSIFFDKYREERILQKFKQQSQANAPKNEGILIPAHLVSTNYLVGVGPVKRSKNSGY